MARGAVWCPVPLSVPGRVVSLLKMLGGGGAAAALGVGAGTAAAAAAPAAAADGWGVVLGHVVP